MRCYLSCLTLLLAPALLPANEPTKIDLARIPPAATKKVDFQKDIEPIFAKACVACHGPEKQRGGVRLDSRDLALQGGNAGKVIVPNKALESRLLHVIAGLDEDVLMPPKERTPLTKSEIGLIRAWIEQGADWPASKVAVAVKAKSDHWSFQPVKRAEAPKTSKPYWIRNGIDAYILQNLDRQKVAPSREADRITLLRRLSFDLIGLPPTPKEVDDFLADTRHDAYECQVDRLLASPHYGERWGRHWLDLARYADSDGYEQDRERHFAFRYRDWVINALNQGMPFDQFTIEQLAGDLLPNATLEQKTATGFHRNTLTNNEGGTDKEQFRVEACIDRVSTTAKVWLGVTMNCCQCHDHKYDPFSQREFYQFFAFFNSDTEVNLPAPLSGEPGKIYSKAQAVFLKKKDELEKALVKYRKAGDFQKGIAKWEAELNASELAKQPAPVLAALKVPAEQRSAEQVMAIADAYAKIDKQAMDLTKAVADHEKTAPPIGIVQTLAMNKPRTTHVMIRGDFLRPGVEVKAGVPSVLPPMQGGSRLDLAQWLMRADNPLTSRVISNWVWHHFFGRGIVPTLEDFGTQGERPSHPELLDFLGSEFIRLKWNLKDLQKLIVTSATYRQSSKARPELMTRDPYNTWLARQNRLRLEAETLRDNALAVSGLLSPAVGGPSVKPPQPAGISELTYANRAKWLESKGADRYRRGLYTWFQRTSPYPMLMTFDAPDSNLCCVRREKSNTPLQALTLLNDTTFVETAQALAQRIQKDVAGSSTERLKHAFRLTVAREPRELELAAMESLYQDVLSLGRANPKEIARLAGSTNGDSIENAAWVVLARTLMNLDEFVNRE